MNHASRAVPSLDGKENSSNARPLSAGVCSRGDRDPYAAALAMASRVSVRASRSE
jgi:hypothetical protein